MFANPHIYILIYVYIDISFNCIIIAPAVLVNNFFLNCQIDAIAFYGAGPYGFWPYKLLISAFDADRKAICPLKLFAPFKAGSPVVKRTPDYMQNRLSRPILQETGHFRRT